MGRTPGQGEKRVLDGESVKVIIPTLDPESRVSGNPYRLEANSGQCFQGSVVLGTGFILEPPEARALIDTDQRNQDVVFPYLNGEDLNSRPDTSASRWVINFGQMTDKEACRYQLPWAIAEKRVKPLRATANQKDYRELWWRFARLGLARNEATANLDRVLVIALLSKIGLPVLVKTGQVFSHMLGVFATDQPSSLALFSSAQHFSWWTSKGESTLETRLRYTPTDGFETFPQPTPTNRMNQAGMELDVFRRSLMQRVDHEMGLTALYNEFHSDARADPDIVRLREIHVEIDEAVREAYVQDEARDPAIREFEARIASAPLPSWREIDLARGFHDTPQGPRFTISPQARTDVLDKLLALNHYRHQQELASGLLNKKKPRARPKPATQDAPTLDGGTLFPPPDTLF